MSSDLLIGRAFGSEAAAPCGIFKAQRSGHSVMAKNKKRYNLFAPRISMSAAAGALADNTVARSALAATLVREVWVHSVKCTYVVDAHTAGEGPWLFGWAHSDYTAAEILECLTAVGSWDISNKILQEQARRKVRIVGTFNGLASEELFNDGRALKSTIKFKLTAGQTLVLWQWNRSGAIFSTGSLIQVNGVAYLKPL